MAYTTLRNGSVRRDDSAVIPNDQGNADWRAYQAWLAGGGVPDAEPETPARVVSGAAFLALFTAAEVAALWAADPRIMAGALKVAAQDSANLDSPDCAALLHLAVDRGALTADRVAQILTGQPPA